MKSYLGISLAAVALVIAYSSYVEPFWLEVTRHSVVFGAPRPIRIAHLSDLHSAGLGRLERKVIESLGLEKPDVIVITGDTVRESTTRESLRPLLSQLKAPQGVFMVPGSADYQSSPGHEFDDAAYYRPFGITLLVNESRKIAEGAHIVGLDDALAGTPDVGKAFRGVESGDRVVALFHSPSVFSKLSHRCVLALGGHTHGGQIRLPFFGAIVLPGESGGFDRGWYQRDKCRLYVSRGIGTSFMNVRFLARPELAYHTLE